ncbi:hypothetical protein [Pseudonocardia asaccharolytica]|uniref:Uncharacterized protein n=1 Tax=Pseudonocardia asaccharolytica DSM 44247 = NBRC 16224 TaxID=1123024 RepID=A0A511CY21_9PSEU|nr:hypothetical protein [Pseudonocardia asaccharolytica]GEL17143.1 hypothetical protein PA7_09800 [Pseudonocardia asaccharolytica DSM 44247 = NBRC 16224]
MPTQNSSSTSPAANRAARRARGKDTRQPLPPQLAVRAGRAAGAAARLKPVHTRTDYAVRRRG